MIKMLNINPSIIIVLFGVGGLFFTFVEDAGLVGSKIPLAIFFIAVICIGIWLEFYLSYQKDNLDIYGEVGGNREFS